MANVRQSLSKGVNDTVAGELFQVAWLLESLARTEIPAYPFQAHHTGEKGVPDFQFISGHKRIAVEMVKVTSQNLEHARSLQSRLPDLSSHYHVDDICFPETFVRKIKVRVDGWYRFIASRLPEEFYQWSESWDEKTAVPPEIKELLVHTLNSIIDGPSIENDALLASAHPRPMLVRIEDFPFEETQCDRKIWLDDALWEEMALPINPTLTVNPFIRKADSRMSQQMVLETGFSIPVQEVCGPALKEEHQIWLDRVRSKIQKKTIKLAGEAFCHGDEDWLVLWDRLGSEKWQVHDRLTAVSQSFQDYWKPDWFSRVFIQDKYFDWQMMFAADGAMSLPVS